MENKIKVFIKNNLGYIIVFFACAVYILTAFLTVDKTGKSVARIIGDGAIAFFLGLFINRIFDMQGMMDAEKDERMMRVKCEHENTVLKVAPYIDKLDEWCECENRKNLCLQRTKLLARVGVRYEDCFDGNGVFIWRTNRTTEHSSRRFYDRRKFRQIRRAAHLKLTALSANELTSEGGKFCDPFYFGRTKRQYETQNGAKELISKVGTALIFGYYGVRLIDEFNYANLVWTTLQVALFLIMGVVSMNKSYSFVIDELRGKIVKKTDTLQKFINYITESKEDDGKKDVQQRN